MHLASSVSLAPTTPHLSLLSLLVPAFVPV